MANSEHVAILKRGVGAWNGWRQKNPAIWPDLRHAKLRGEDLGGANFIMRYFLAADFRDANLRRADFSRAELWGTSFLRSDLREAKLIAADRRGAKLSKANLVEAQLSGADLEGYHRGHGLELCGKILSTKEEGSA